MGTGKTHFQLCLFFVALEAGVDAVWLDEPTMQAEVTASRNHEPATSLRGKNAIERWRRAEALFFNDVGFDDNPPSRDLPGRPLLSNLYWHLLEKSSSALWASMNPHPSELCGHPDVGDRVVSRMLGRFTGGLPPLVVKFDGEDQRLARLLAQPKGTR